MKRSSSIALSLLVLCAFTQLAAQHINNSSCAQTKQENTQQLICYATDVYNRVAEIIQNTESKKTRVCAQCVENDDEVKSILRQAAQKGFDAKRVYRQASIIAQEEHDKVTELVLYFLSKDSVKSWFRKHPALGYGAFAGLAVLGTWGGKAILNWFKGEDQLPWGKVVEEHQESKHHNGNAEVKSNSNNTEQTAANKTKSSQTETKVIAQHTIVSVKRNAKKKANKEKIASTEEAKAEQPTNRSGGNLRKPKKSGSVDLLDFEKDEKTIKKQAPPIPYSSRSLVNKQSTNSEQKAIRRSPSQDKKYNSRKRSKSKMRTKKKDPDKEILTDTVDEQEASKTKLTGPQKPKKPKSTQPSVVLPAKYEKKK